MKISEKECRSALNRSGIPGVDYCLNPYTGCEHGCVYCYASFMKRFCGIEDKWGSFVQVKSNFPARLAVQLQRCRPGRVMLSSVTDPYQPLERHYRLTRSCLGLLAEENFRVSILTKSDLVLQDLNLLKKIPDVEVGFTITTADRDIARFLEPGAPSPERRFAALARLADAGIRTWVFIAPVVPGLGDTEANLSAILEKARRAGAREVDYDPLNFYPTSVANLKSLFRKRWPRLFPFFQAACEDQAGYRAHLSSLARELWFLYGFASTWEPDAG
ncbi:MAG: radical SAM protein [Bacillota bacterium]|nr:radical SAM protein [Bacillota bacterium]